MSKIKLLTIAVIGLLVVNIAVVVFLVTRRPGMDLKKNGPAKQEGPKQIVIDKLHFDQAQTAAYERLITEHRMAIRGLKDSISNAKQRLYESLKSDDFILKDSLINVLSVLQKRIESVHYEHFIEIKKLCKPPQIDAFNALTNELAFYFSTEKKSSSPPPHH
jgi:periplasmic protein CpxP/Spy